MDLAPAWMIESTVWGKACEMACQEPFQKKSTSSQDEGQSAARGGKDDGVNRAFIEAGGFDVAAEASGELASVEADGFQVKVAFCPERFVP